jgi:hypothetical protein
MLGKLNVIRAVAHRPRRRLLRPQQTVSVFRRIKSLEIFDPLFLTASVLDGKKPSWASSYSPC